MTDLSRSSVSNVLIVVFWNCSVLLGMAQVARESIPLPEHPRPDFHRAEWLNLNGAWQFRFDGDDAGLKENWLAGQVKFPDTVLVPFPWGSPLSQVKDEAPIAWYSREVRVPQSWQGRRVFLVIGACDWETQAWLDGQPLGAHRGGYTPFEFELTQYVKPGQEHRIVLRVDDRPRSFKLEGKQGYGNARGIWQTVYLEARPESFLTAVHFAPDIDHGKVAVTGRLRSPAPANTALTLRFKTGGLPDATRPVTEGARQVRFDVAIPNARLWSLDDPFLYEVEAVLRQGASEDRVEHVLRHAQDQRGQTSGHGLALHRPEQPSRVPPDDAGSVVSS